MTGFKVCATLLLFGLMSTACVSSSTHEKLQKDDDQKTAALAADEARLKDNQEKMHQQDLIVQDLTDRLGKTANAKLKLESNVTEMQAALDALKKQREEADKRISEFRDLVTKFKTLTDTGKLTVKMVDGQMVVTLSSDVLFSSGSAHLSKAGTEAIQEVSSLLASVPDRKYQVEGFTDNVPIKTEHFPSNWELASARAVTVVKTMLESGIPAERVSAASFGETHPIASNDTEEGRKANRRIVITVVPDLSTLPGYDQLQKMSGN